MSLKTRLSDLFQHMEDLQLGLYDRLSEAERTRTGTEQNWSAKDNLFHNMYWSNFHLSNLETFEREGVWPEREDGGDFDKTNAVVFAQYRDKTWDEVHTWTRETYARGRSYLERKSDDDLLNPMPDEFENQRPVWRNIVGNFVTHPMIHLWDYLRQNGQEDTVAELFGDEFSAKLLAVSDDPEWHGTTLYNLACIYALSGKTDRAIETLGEALRLRPDLTEWSKEDADLESLHGEPGYQALYE